MVARDSRNMAFGILPLLENPGGGEGGDFGMENISVRRNFTPVPIYLPHVKVGADGMAHVHVKLPDTLTVYMLRAKATSGADRFGFGTGQIRIRQPVVAQPALPRFVRPGDKFDASVIGARRRRPRRRRARFAESGWTFRRCRRRAVVRVRRDQARHGWNFR